MERGDEFDNGYTPPAAQVAAFNLGRDSFPPPPPACDRGDVTSHTPPGSPTTIPSSDSSGNSSSDRATLLSQIPRSASGIFTPDAKHIPTRRGAIRMVNIPPPQMYPDQFSGLGRPPTPFVTREASMPMPSMDGFGPPYGRQSGVIPLDSSSPTESNSMPEIVAHKLRDHRRNKTTVSNMNEMLKSLGSELEVPPGSSFETSLPVASSLMSEDEWSQDNCFAGPLFKYETSEQISPPSEELDSAMPDINTTPEVERPSPYAVWSNALLRRNPTYDNLPSPTPLCEGNLALLPHDTGHCRSKSGGSNSSGSTVASTSWNPAPPPQEENRQRAQTLSLFKSITAPREMNPEYITEKGAREEYPLDEFEAGGPEHGIDFHDYACLWPSPKIVRRDESDHAPSSSEISTASDQVMIDLDDCEVSGQEGGKQINVEGKAGGIFDSSAAANADQFLLPATVCESFMNGALPIADENSVLPVGSGDDELSITPAFASTPVQETGDTPMNDNPNDILSVHRWSSSSSQHHDNDKNKRGSLLQRLSGHFPISKLLGLAKTVSGRGKDVGNVKPRIHCVLDRSFQFPASGPVQDEQRVGSELIQTTAPATSPVVHKRQSSFGRLLSVLGSKKGEERGEGVQRRSHRRLQKKRLVG
jgi:hypothetical protein